jgi:hypothetical protein
MSDIICPWCGQSLDDQYFDIIGLDYHTSAQDFDCTFCGRTVNVQPVDAFDVTKGEQT